MSHFTKVATKINSLAALEKALAKLGMKFVRGESGVPVEVRGWRGQKLEAEAKIETSRYDIGLVKAEDGSYELVADWWGIETTIGKTEKELVEEIGREYAYVRVIEACEAQGYQIAREDIQVAEDGSVQLLATKWG